MRRLVRNPYHWCFLGIAMLSLLLSGCATESDNLSERPWNEPKSWENGLPSGLTEGR